MNESPSARRSIFYGWYVIAVACVGAFLSAGVSQAFMGVMLKPITEDLGWSRTAVSGALTAGTFTGGMIAPVFGRLADKFGPRYLSPMGGAAVALAFFGLSFVTELWQFYIFYIFGRAVAQVTLSGVVPQTAAANWFRRKRGRAMGFIQTGNPLGGAILAVLGTAIIASHGWRDVFIVFGVITLIAFILPPFLVLRRRPEDMGLLPDGAMSEESADGHGRPDVPESESWSLNEALRTKAIWLIAVALFVGSLANGAVSFHQVAYFTDLGISPGAAAFSISLYAFAGALAITVWGFLVEHLDERVLVIVALFAGGVTIFTLLLVNNALTASLFAVSFGLFARGESSLVMMLLAQYYGRHSYGAISGFTTPMQMAGLGFGPLVASVAFDLTGTYRGAFVVFGLLFVIAAVLMLMVRKPMKPSARTTDASAHVVLPA